MTSPPDLAIAYITRSPESAGRVLSSMSAEASAAFINSIPTPHAVKLVAGLQPITAARIVQTLDGDVAADIFRHLDFTVCSSIVRQMDRATRTQFLSRLAKRTRAAIEKSLSFGLGTVGAHMTTTIATLSESDSTEAALAAIRQSDRDHIDVVFVVNGRGEIAGIVSSANALRHSAGTRLSTVLDNSCAPVSAHSKLDAIADPALWNDFAYLPVINRRRELIGAISRKALQSARAAAGAGAVVNSRSIPASMLDALATTSTGLLNLVSDPAAAGRLRGESNER